MRIFSLPPDSIGVGGRDDGKRFIEREVDDLAWGFLGSEFTGLTYAAWPVERRIDAYLIHHGMTSVLHNGDQYDALLQQVLAHVGEALRTGILRKTRWPTAAPQSLTL